MAMSHAFDTIAGRINDVIELGTGDVHSQRRGVSLRAPGETVHGIQMVLRDDGMELRAGVRSSDRAAMEARIRARLPGSSAAGDRPFRYVEDLETNRAGKRRWYVDRRTNSASQP